MKKSLTLLTLLVALSSCGGGGGGSTNLSSENTTATSVTYLGAASQGDLAKFSLNGNSLTYEVQGPVFGDVKGNMTIQVNQQKPFYKGEVNGTQVYMMLSGNIGFADVIINGTDTLLVGLSNIGNLTDSEIAGKDFVYVEVLNTGEVGGYTIRLNSDHTWTMYDFSGNLEDSGSWQMTSENYVNATDSYGNTYHVIIKPGISRAGFIVDLPNGFGIGLEQKALTQNEITGTYSYYSYDVQYDEDCFGTVKVWYDNSTNTYKYLAKTIWCDDPADIGYEENGTLTPNSPVNGTLTLTDPQGNKGYIFLDPEDGYFTGVGVDSNGYITDYMIGSNKY
ncbi:putative lipoprotein [Thermovibrio ammonificans HB-1]|uniref:Lipoprotein n=1 Tax=Thermovibrio ammonificans (strain DSM 15698 / JCM 12110 / HB-1) TaxID=648996 RepID=E8T467_THEA1|nr:hypothetical protein [Thermovibrio ammonificans]ADU97396.1 putative lipoprotein [Thermovibrio ammonificans HB-1]